MSKCPFACVLFSGILWKWTGYGLHNYGGDFPYYITLMSICLSLRPESVTSVLLPSPRTPIAPGLKYFEMPKTLLEQTESKPTRPMPDNQQALQLFNSSHKQNPDFQDCTTFSVNELLPEPRTHLSKKTIQLGHPKSQPEHVQHNLLTPTKPQPAARALQAPLLHLSQIATTSDTKTIGRMAVAHKKAVTMDLG